MNQRILNLLFHPVNMNTRHYYLKKNDFTFEGTMREYEIKNQNKIHVDVYSMLKSEWQKKSV